MSEQFPLGETSTIYMSGEQLYSIIQHDKPGYRQQVVLLPEQAQEIRDVVKTAIQEAEQRGAVKALREAAKDWRWSAWAEAPKNRIAAANYTGDWLESRADRLEGDDE